MTGTDPLEPKVHFGRTECGKPGSGKRIKAGQS